MAPCLFKELAQVRELASPVSPSPVLSPAFRCALDPAPASFGMVDKAEVPRGWLGGLQTRGGCGPPKLRHRSRRRLRGTPHSWPSSLLIQSSCPAMPTGNSFSCGSYGSSGSLGCQVRWLETDMSLPPAASRAACMHAPLLAVPAGCHWHTHSSCAQLPPLCAALWNL